MKTSANPPPAPTRRNKRKRDSSPLSKTADVDVSLRFATRLSPIESNGSNTVFSPLSLRALLSLVAAGASGPTAEQLLYSLKSESIDDLNALSSKLLSKVLSGTSGRGPKLSFANGVWFHDGFSLKHSFKQVVGKLYKADFHQCDFITQAEEIETEVNSWAKDKTKGLILEILPRGSVSENARLILTNALYFKGTWLKDYFKIAKTKDHKFRLLDGKNSVKAPFMRSNLDRHCIATFDGFKVLRLDYKQKRQSNFSMYILLPDSVDGLAALADRVASEPDFFELHLSEVKSVRVGEFGIPKFKVSFGFRAAKILKRLGVTSPFKAGALSEMVDPPEEGQELCLKEIYQKSFIEVNEKGTTAAAATSAVLFGCSMLPPEKVDFVADHPFMFVIREEASGAVLFLGHVLNPLKE